MRKIRDKIEHSDAKLEDRIFSEYMKKIEKEEHRKLKE